MRDWDDPEYKEWRLAVLKRDRFKCKSCGARKGLECHHIYPWSECPSLRYDVKNGITVCKKCHKTMNKNEHSWIGFCHGLQNKNTYINIKRDMRRMKDEDDK